MESGAVYVPAHFAATDELLRSFLDAGVLADLVTVGPEGLDATPLPLLLNAEGTSLHGHLARNNRQWEADGSPCLVIVRGADAYVSPGWYPSKREHGRVVPTWNYEVVHVHGRLVTHDDAAWTEDLVRRLTERHEAAQQTPWSVDDAPATFTSGQVRAIVGIEVRIDRIQSKSKLSQNRPRKDLEAVADVLGAGDPSQRAVAERMREEPAEQTASSHGIGPTVHARRL